MDDKLRQTLIDDYNSLLADMQSDNIKRLEFGFISDDCIPMLFSILIHCMENIEVFNSTQLNNISNFINKLSYVG